MTWCLQLRERLVAVSFAGDILVLNQNTAVTSQTHNGNVDEKMGGLTTFRMFEVIRNPVRKPG